MMDPSVGVIVITYNAAHLIEGCLRPVMASPLRPRVLVVNSSSDDGTVEKARALGAETWVVPRRSFNHGRTREAARRRLGTDIVVMLTPDAHAEDPAFLERLVRPIRRGEAAVAYGRQAPRANADLLERAGRAFSYPAHSQLRGATTRERYGACNHFCSNACAAWDQRALDAIGGFPTTLVSEETLAAALLIGQGHAIAYVADAVVVHSHPTRLLDGLKRQFDVGFTRSVYKDLLLAHGSDETRGRAYLRDTLRLVWRQRPTLLPYALIDAGTRYLGYRLGRLGPWLPRSLSASLSSQDFFWRSPLVDAFLRGDIEQPPAGGGRLRDAA